ncbi:MAG TPA: DUF4350 domain-containing protein [Desulfobulbus sp.]|nr:DUF4350 domain-containing protein [Desulfobulbus sp.]
MTWRAHFQPGSRPVSVGIVLLLIMGSLFWFFTRYEYRPVEVNVPVSPAARMNPLLAAERFLAGLGWPVESHRGRDLLVHLPPAGDALVVLRMSGNLSPTRIGEIFAWIEAGGHLVLAPAGYTEDDGTPDETGLLGRVGVLLRHAPAGDDCGCDDETTPGRGASATAGADRDPAGEEDTAQETTVRVTLDNRQVTLAPDPYSYLEDSQGTASLAIGDSRGNGAVLLQYRIGSGRLTVLNSMDIFTNSGIGSRDHAFLLAWLVTKNRKTWLLYSSDMDGLPVLLWRKQAPFLLALAMTLVLLLWSWQYRLGPLQEEEERGRRRNVLAHIDASGRYGWRIDRAASLLAANRRFVLRRLAVRHAGRTGAEPDRERIAARTGLTPDEVETALFAEARSEQDFLAVTHFLQQLRNRSGAGPGHEGRQRD